MANWTIKDWNKNRPTKNTEITFSVACILPVARLLLEMGNFKKNNETCAWTPNKV